MPPSTMNNSNSGQTLRKWRYCSSVQKPMTCSMPARLYQLRSKITISPAVVDSAIGPGERFESIAGRLGRNSLQSDILQQLATTSPALLSKQVCSVFDHRDKH